MAKQTPQEIVQSLLESAQTMKDMGIFRMARQYQRKAETAACDFGIFDEMFPELAADRDYINRLELAH